MLHDGVCPSLTRYKQDGNKDFTHVKEGLKFLHILMQ
jgi:hypothetical protein